ncbi:MAG: aquaporin [Bacteroidetes bacterium]|nr:MAG: aquaporin [Bacteroidota bacterium]
MKLIKELVGELVGTLILVFIGCGSVAIAVVYYPLELWQVALIWGVGVAMAIYAVKQVCPAHLNPAVSFAMMLSGKLDKNKFIPYVIFQLLGAVIAGFLLLSVIDSDLKIYETVNSILRGATNSYHSAVMFGEFFPNPGYEQSLYVSHFQACIAECIGTFALIITIFILTNKPRKIEPIIPALIGLTVTLIILVVAPYTQAGLNPARDFGPRIVAYFGGWNDAAFPHISYSFLTVYILSPLAGGTLAWLVNKRLHRIFN